MINYVLENDLLRMLRQSSATDEEKDIIFNFIEGEGKREDIPCIKLNGNYGIFYTIEAIYNTQYVDQVLRTCYVLYKIIPNEFFESILKCKYGYKICHELEIEPKEVVKRTFSLLGEQISKCASAYELLVILEQYLNKKQKSITMQAKEYYEGAFLQYIQEDKSQEQKDIVIRLFIKLIKDVKSDQALLDYREEMEPLFNKLYINKEEQVTLINEENRNDLLLRRFFMIMHLYFYKQIEWLRPFLAKQLETEGGKFCEIQLRWINYNADHVRKVLMLMEELDISMETKIAYYANTLISEEIGQWGRELNRLLKQLYKVAPHKVKQVYKTLVKQPDCGCIALFAFLKKEGMSLSEEDFLDMKGVFELNYVKEQPKEIKGNYTRRRIVERKQGVWLGCEFLDEAWVEVEKMIATKRYEGLIELALPIQTLFWENQENILSLINKRKNAKEIIEQAIEREDIEATVLGPFLIAHRNEAEELLIEKIKLGKDNIIQYIKAYYTEDLGFKKSILASVFSNKLKTVISFMEAFVSDREDELRDELLLLHKKKNKNMQEALHRVENKWNQQKYIKAIEACEDKEQVLEYIKKLYTPEHDNNIPYRQQAFQNEKDGALIKYYVAEYMLAKEIVIIPACEALRKFIEPKVFNEQIRALYVSWLQDGANVKHKNIVMIYALSANDHEITLLKKQIDTWVENARGALAAFAVTAMALNGSSIALMLTDSISRKYKNKQVKGAAANAMDYVAKVRGVSKEALADKIVPNLGFDETRRQMLDYGPRKFKVTLTPELDLQIFDEEKGKVIKSLPKPTQKDDEEKATAAKAYLTGIKKQMKTVIATQKQRLSKALLSGRSWDKENWEQVFIKNPIMNGFAMSLIWGAYDESGVLLSTFRYMEDGSFNTVDEEEYDISEAVSFRLMHPLDLSEEEFEGWKEQLEDYEITQAVSQLDMPIYTLTEEERKRDSYISFADKEVYYGQILKVMEQYDWQKTEAMDAGRYDGYYYYDEITDIGMIMLFEGLFMGINPAETVKVEELVFCKGDISDKCYYFNKNEHKNIVIDPKDVPEKVLNFGLLVINTICKGKEEN